MVTFTQNDNDFLFSAVRDKFMRYVTVDTGSVRHPTTTPSSQGQWELARMLEGELRSMGLSSVTLSPHAYCLARLPASAGLENAPVVGFLAHLDTSSDVSGKGVVPLLVKNYDGGKIALKHGLALDPHLDASLASCKGHSIIHTDGSTLLGADDKAGIAEIMAAVEFLTQHPEVKHGAIEIVFTPDEETGAGLPELPLDWFKSKACYTFDGGEAGEFEIECFNAATAFATFSGRAIHPGAARGVMVNASLMAAYFANMLPRSESPEATDGYYGYYYLTNIEGNHEKASLELLVRGFTRDDMARRSAALKSFALAVEAQFPGGKAQVEIEPSYSNMREAIEKHPEVIERLKAAALNVGVNWKLKPVRGGTDGARLTQLGIPTPNIFTGGRNFHSRLEWASLDDMTLAAKLAVELAALWGQALSG